MDSIMNHLPKVHSDSNDLVEYLKHIYDAANDIEQIAKALKVMPIIEPYADNILGSIIIIRANINCIQNIPHIYDKTADVQPAERVIELEELLEECRSKFLYLLDLGMESTSDQHSIQKLYDKIQAKLNGGDTNDT